MVDLLNKGADVATTGTIASILVDEVGCTLSAARFYAQELREKKVLRGKGQKHGKAVDLSAVESLDWLIAQTLAPSISTAVETIQRVNALELRFVSGEDTPRDASDLDRTRAVFAYLRGLGIGALDNFGKVLATIVEAMRTNVFDEWAGGVETRVVVDFYNGGTSAAIYVHPNVDRKGTVLSFGPDEQSPPVSRILRIDERLLRRFADALGPPPEGT